ncbi:MAG TPA: hypothetical protein VFS35_00930 [Terrimicrobiaceae bacterium]|nr:hypothetical protein [Terrimicrobiaceae bacterium]
MNAFLYTENLAAILAKPRSRQAELYFNGVCLLRTLLNRDWAKARFFLRNLQRALTE